MTNVPAEHIKHVAAVITELESNGVPPGDLFVAVSDGELELRDETGSYGVRRWSTR